METQPHAILEDYREEIDGGRFFLRSPFRSVSFLLASSLCLACVLFDTYSLHRDWSRLSTGAAYALYFAGYSVVIIWGRVYRGLSKLGELYAAAHTPEGKPDTRVDVMMGIAASTSIQTLFFSTGTIFFMVFFAFHLLSRVPVK
jgi:hypothetical protein